jgi:NAD(P)-dependent dehydrogenase (short-subunit alcohol dehydrogenase family)
MQRDHSYRTTPQAPIHSGFGPDATARDVLRGHELRGKTALVTGGYSGIGLETTRALAEAGAAVIVPARTPNKARAAMGGMPRVELDRWNAYGQSKTANALFAVALDTRGHGDGIR